jgi:hypothetical protein
MIAARKIPAEKRVIFAIDCDEFISANSFQSLEWKAFTENAVKGSLLVCNRLMISENFDEYSKEPDFLIGFVDDEHSTIEELSIKKHIHNIRLPFPSNNPDLYYVHEIKLLHFNVVDYTRFKSKMRWYQCYEVILEDKGLISILDQYFFDKTFEEFWLKRERKPFQKEWLRGYDERGIPISMVLKKSSYYWDEKIMGYFEKHGLKKFGKLPIWDIQWFEDTNSKRDQRSFTDKVFLRLYLFQRDTNSALLKKTIRILLKYLSK